MKYRIYIVRIEERTNSNGEKMAEYGDILITTKQTEEYSKKFGLKNILTSFDLWAIGTGSAIAGTFFGWNKGLELASPGGFVIATIIVTIFYFILSTIFHNLASSLPYAGGPYAYARKALGPAEGYFAGVLTIIEFASAAAAVTATIDYYIEIIYPGKLPFPIGILCCVLFLITDILGTRISAIVQIVLTLLAISSMTIFFIATAPSSNFSLNLLRNISLNNLNGITQALPYAIWLYLCIEGIVLSSEETKTPKVNIKSGLRSSLITVYILNLLILIFCMAFVNQKSFQSASFPLLQVLQIAQPQDKVVFAVFSTIAISNFLASLHGMIIGCSRQVFALSRAGYFPSLLSKLHTVTKTPFLAIILSQAICVLLYFLFDIYHLIFTAVIAAFFMYIIVIHSYINIKTTEFKKSDNKKKKYNLCLYGLNAVLLISLIIALVKSKLLISFLFLFAGIILYYVFIGRRSILNDAPEEMEARVDKITIR